ncbi:MAG: hypothetical protein Ct9H300mP5_3940 [Candidatus Pelagibacterales bacterium]|nr:MAG: hypothetical protein Ct9H300mP5_3940 [Pelagibacterales bacterium]
MEIGTGWGGFALYAAKNYGCRITSTTISQEQFIFSENLIKKNGLQDQVTILKKDFRELEGQFDKLVSIEMIEAIGHRLYKTFFQKWDNYLSQRVYSQYKQLQLPIICFMSPKDFIDFISNTFFQAVDSFISALCSAASSSDIKLFHLEDITPHYARTSRNGEPTFCKIKAALRTWVHESFYSTWLFYLCYCEGGFIERQIGMFKWFLPSHYVEEIQYYRTETVGQN